MPMRNKLHPCLIFFICYRAQAMRYFYLIICTLCLLWTRAESKALPPSVKPVVTTNHVATSEATEWYNAVREALSQFPKKGGYATNKTALSALVHKGCRWDAKNDTPLYFPKKAKPSFCSSAIYLLILRSLQIWDSNNPKPRISKNAWLHLAPRMEQKDGDGPWGWANANGPGLAVLVHSLGAGFSFENWNLAKPGDFMKIFWSSELGKNEFGHLTLLIKQSSDSVTFWSSNLPNGYGTKTIPKSQVKRVIFTRITRPSRFNQAPRIRYNSWLNSLLTTPVSIREVRRRSGIKSR